MYYVFVPGTNGPRHVHETYAQAEAEAKRIIRERGANEATICQVMSVIHARIEVETPVQWKARKAKEEQEQTSKAVLGTGSLAQGLVTVSNPSLSQHLQDHRSAVAAAIMEAAVKKSVGRPKKATAVVKPTPDPDEVPF